MYVTQLSEFLKLDLNFAFLTQKPRFESPKWFIIHIPQIRILSLPAIGLKISVEQIFAPFYIDTFRSLQFEHRKMNNLIQKPKITMISLLQGQ
jgi:hypothetical protein